MGVVFDLLRAIAEYWFRIRKRKSEGVKIAFTEELSMERYAVCDDNPLAIDYRDFSLLANSNPKLIAMGNYI